MSSAKQSNGKTEWHLIPWRELEEVARVFMYGKSKYSEDDWENVENKRSVYFDAAMRHLTAWWNGEKKDESEFSHLAHAICCLLILLWDKNNKDGGSND